MFLSRNYSVFAWYCCDRKSRAAYTQSFALWQQATIEFACHDHSIIACSRHTYEWCCSSRTSRSLWITHSTQHLRRGCNSIINKAHFYEVCNVTFVQQPSLTLWILVKINGLTNFTHRLLFKVWASLGWNNSCTPLCNSLIFSHLFGVFFVPTTQLPILVYPFTRFSIKCQRPCIDLEQWFSTWSRWTTDAPPGISSGLQSSINRSWNIPFSSLTYVQYRFSTDCSWGVSKAKWSVGHLFWKDGPWAKKGYNHWPRARAVEPILKFQAPAPAPGI